MMEVMQLLREKIAIIRAIYIRDKLLDYIWIDTGRATYLIRKDYVQGNIAFLKLRTVEN